VIAAGQVNVVAAQAFSLEQGKILDVFHVQNNEKQALTHLSDLDKLITRIEKVLDDKSPLSAPKTVHIRTNILMKRVPVRVRTLPLASFQQTAIEVAMADRPGLLAALTYQISILGFDINGAAISSFGERIVDVFFIQSNGKLLDDEELDTLFVALKSIATLDNEHEAIV